MTSEQRASSLRLGMQKMGLNQLTDLIAKAGLLKELGDKNTDFTLFAPTDESIQEYLNSQPEGAAGLEDEAVLRDLLLNHVVPGKVMASDIKDGMKVKNLANKILELRISEDGVGVGNAMLGRTDLSALNLVVHEVASVISPKGLQEAESADGVKAVSEQGSSQI